MTNERPPGIPVIENIRGLAGIIAPLPPAFSPALANDNLVLFNQRQKLLLALDDLAMTDSTELGGKEPHEAVREAHLSRQAARTILEALAMISTPSSVHGMEFTAENLENYTSVFPLLLSDLRLGDEVVAIFREDVRGEIDAPAGEKLTERYMELAEKLDEMWELDSLSPGQRLPVAKDVLSLLVLVSHPQRRVVDQEIPGEGKTISAIATSFLTKYQLGPEIAALLEGGGEPLPSLYTTVPTKAVEPETKTEEIELRELSDKIRRGEGITLNIQVVAGLAGGFGGMTMEHFERRAESKAYADPGASHIEKFKSNFVQPVRNTLEKNLQVEENIKKQAEFLARIDLILLGVTTGPVRLELLNALRKESRYETSDLDLALQQYIRVLTENPASPKSLKGVVDFGPPVQAEEGLRFLQQKLSEAPVRSFGVAEYLASQYRGGRNPNDETLLRFIASVNQLATNAQVRQNMRFSEIF